MRAVLLGAIRAAAAVLICAAAGQPALQAQSAADVGWSGSVRDASGHLIARAEVELQSAGQHYHPSTKDSDAYSFSVRARDQVFQFPDQLSLPIHGLSRLTLLANGAIRLESDAETQASGGETLSGTSVAAIPLNKRDYWFDWRNYHPDTTIFRH